MSALPPGKCSGKNSCEAIGRGLFRDFPVSFYPVVGVHGSQNSIIGYHRLFSCSRNKITVIPAAAVLPGLLPKIEEQPRRVGIDAVPTVLSCFTKRKRKDRSAALAMTQHRSSRTDPCKPEAMQKMSPHSPNARRPVCMRFLRFRRILDTLHSSEQWIRLKHGRKPESITNDGHGGHSKRRLPAPFYANFS